MSAASDLRWRLGRLCYRVPLAVVLAEGLALALVFVVLFLLFPLVTGQ